jgi:hypothetical protein
VCARVSYSFRILAGVLSQLLIQLPDLVQVLRTELFQVHHCIVRALCGTYHLIEFEQDCRAVTVLRVLDQEDHQESHDRGAGIDNELPCIAIVENPTQ